MLLKNFQSLCPSRVISLFTLAGRRDSFLIQLSSEVPRLVPVQVTQFIDIFPGSLFGKCISGEAVMVVLGGKNTFFNQACNCISQANRRSIQGSGDGVQA